MNRASELSAVSASLMLPSSMRDQIVAHAREHAPRECCGVIGGKDGQATSFHRLTNLESGTDFYRIDDTELFRVYRDIDGRDDDILAIYHSHPVSPAYPSKTDVALAAWPDAFYLICSLQNPGQPDLHAFRIVAEQIIETDLTFSG